MGTFSHTKSPKIAPNQKNVRIVLVGNNNSKNYKSNDNRNLQFNQGIIAANLPKTTKNGISKFYSGGQDVSLPSGGSYMVNKK